MTVEKWTEISDTLDTLTEELGHFPSLREIRNSRFSGLRSVIQDLYGGINNVKKRKGIEPPEVKPPNYWTEETVKEMMISLEAKLGHFPVLRDISEHDGGAIRVIYRIYGNFGNFQLAMGQKITRPKRSEQNILTSIKRMLEETGEEVLPPRKRLKELGYSALAAAINKKGGYHHYRHLLNHQSQMKPPRTWNEEFTLKELKKYIKDNQYESMPSSSVILKEYSSLGAAITKFGGFPKFRIKLGEKVLRIDGKWHDVKFAYSKAQAMLDELGLKRLPSSYKIGKLGYSGLLSAINKHHGGIVAFRAKFESVHQQFSEKNELESIIDDYIGDSDE